MSLLVLFSAGCSLDASLLNEKASQLLEGVTPDNGATVLSGPAVTFTSPSRLRVNYDSYVWFELQFSNADTIEIDETDIIVSGSSATCEVYFDSSEGYYVELYNCSGDGTVSVGVAPGVARSSDGKSSVQTASPFLITVDNVAPFIEITSPAAGNSITDSRSFAIPVKIYKVADIFNTRRTSGVLLGDGSFVPWGWDASVTAMDTATQNAVKSGV